jgi:4-amino-4-deoxy-L-arabinose transferase-like glycosyltransferase
MKNIFAGHKHFSILVLVFIIAEIIIAPVGDFPLNDDWSYAKGVRVFNETSEFNFGTWPAMTLCSHILWGSLFTRVFGFSHFVLRFSTIVSAIIAIIFLYKLIVKINGNKTTATFVCAVMLFNPIFFNLVNTYMTDVNFCTLTILCCYYIYRFHETGRLIYFLPVFFFSALLILVRQFGIIVPVCFAFSCFLVREKKLKAVLMSLLVLAAVIAVFKIYEGYLGRILPKGSTYKFSGNLGLLTRVFWDNFFIAFKSRYSTLLLHVLIYISPIALFFLIDLFRRSKIIVSISVSVIAFITVYIVLNKEPFPFQNIFSNMKLGPETFYESMQGRHHAMSDDFNSFMAIVKFVFTGITLTTVFLWLVLRFKEGPARIKSNPTVIFLLFYSFSYIFLLLITESYFDRYHLPLIITCLILFTYALKNYRVNYALPLVFLIPAFYVSVAGTKDYFSWQEKRWEAFNFLTQEHKVPKKWINAGFEVTSWTDPEYIMSFDFLNKEKLFIIQFEHEEGFRPLKEYEFQRYFPYKKDKINIFVREEKK